MKTIKIFNKSTSIVLLLVLIMSSCFSFSQNKENTDKTLSPYFHVVSENPENEQLPLKSTSANVNIAGVIADVVITQEYKNEGKNPIEAIYIFPASTRAAIYGLKMTIGERIIIAKIEEKEKARQDYEQAKNDGKSASLLEQKRPNVFQMNVANIMPEDIIKVEISYTELLIPEEGIYEFVYPTVVGPRYSNQPELLASNEEAWVSNPYTHEGELPLYTFDISLNIKAGLALNDVRCISHNIDVVYNGSSEASVSLKNQNSFEGNRDFVLQYRLTGNKIESGLLLFEGENENFFLAMVQPPKIVREEIIPPREYIFIIDISGSMYGFPLNTSKKLLKDIIGNLKTSDKFNVMLFAGSSKVLFESSLPATQTNIKKAINHIDNQRGGGGTELLPAIKRALALKGTEDYSRTFIIATDGYVTVEKEVFEIIRKNLNNANFFPFGIGSSVNRYIIEGMAHAGMGEPFIVLNPEEASAKANKFRKYIQNPALTNIKVKYNGFEAYDVEPLTVPDVLAERPVIIYGKWKGKPEGNITITGRTGNGNYSETISVNKTKVSKNNVALRYLWAREKIKLLGDYRNFDNYDDSYKNEITELGLKYNLLTDYTSFVAIDSHIRNNSGNVSQVKQPLPLPQGVNNYALGGYKGSFTRCEKKSTSYDKSKDNSPNKYSEILEVVEDIEITGAEEELDEQIFFIVEIMPEFKGGENALEKFIKNNINHKIVNKLGISGKVIISFTINIDGTIKDIRVIKKLHPELDKEAIRIIKLTAKMWNPGKQRGKPVAVKMNIPILF
ncbi:MAG: TonB family protein [Bacteroidales bacterium]|nr:TonB family protein [Bacteroidales bacterium]